MGIPTRLSLSALLLQAVCAVIAPEYHSIMWKFEDSNFWAPLGLNTAAFELESPAGSSPEGLKKRTELKGVQYLPCTIVTLDAGLSGDTLNATLATYSALKDDVWSEAQVSVTHYLKLWIFLHICSFSNVSSSKPPTKLQALWISLRSLLSSLKTNSLTSSYPTRIMSPDLSQLHLCIQSHLLALLRTVHTLSLYPHARLVST